MAKIIDFHTHLFSNPFSDSFSKLPFASLPDPVSRLFSLGQVQNIRKKTREWMKPVVGSIHQAQTWMRYLPEVTRKGIDQLGALVPIAGLLVESTPQDLIDAMDEAGVDLALVIAHPPFITNEFIMEVCSNEPRFIPVVNIPKGTSKPGSVFKEYVKNGARVLKIHTAADGEGVDSIRYRKLLTAASELGTPVILHTGCIHSSILYKNPHQAQAQMFEPWFKKYSDIQFILAHMNFHDPSIALDVCEEYENVFVDTSWQPSEVIGEAVRRIGAERILFGTDWPLVGNNMSIGRRRIDECIQIGLLKEDEAQLILGVNAMKLLKLGMDAN